MAKKKIPRTTRWCLSCKTLTEWEYNHVVGHSRCTECGGFFSSSEEIPEEKLEEVARKLMPWVK